MTLSCCPSPAAPFILVRRARLFPAWKRSRPPRANILCQLSKVYSTGGSITCPVKRLSRAVSSLSYQSIDAAPELRLAPGGRCGERPWPHPGGILMGMQMAFGLATSADIDPPGPEWWRMDCQPRMRGVWNASSHVFSQKGSVPSVFVRFARLALFFPTLYPHSAQYASSPFLAHLLCLNSEVAG